MAKDTSFARATPVTTDDVRGVDDPGGTPLTRRFQLSAIYTLFKTSLDTAYNLAYMALVAPSTSGNVLTSNGSAWTSAAPAKIAGDIVQVVHTQTGAVATGTTTIPGDDTIPQNTEGDQYMSLAITPTSATNKLVIEFIGNFSIDLVKFLIVALFQDTTANALAACLSTIAGNTYANQASLRYEMVAGTTSATTFKIRAGGYGAGGTVTFNGVSGGRYFGGVMNSSLRITEIKV